MSKNGGEGDINEASGSKPKHFADEDVCRPYLLGVCLSELFNDTRIDPGPCKKVHSDILKNEYEVAHESEDYNFNEEVLKYLQRFMDDIDSRTKANKERIQNYQIPDANAKVEEIARTIVQIGEMLSKSENIQKGERTKESDDTITEVEKLKSKKVLLIDEYNSLGIPRMPQQQAIMVVCDVCGAFLNASDKDDFFATHVKAKMHSNVMAVREKIYHLQ